MSDLHESAEAIAADEAAQLVPHVRTLDELPELDARNPHQSRAVNAAIYAAIFVTLAVALN